MTNLDSIFGEGNGNPLQYSCLANPRDGGASWAAVYGVAQSWTWLKCLSSSSSRQHIKKQRHYFANKGPSSQGCGFYSSHVWMWELDGKESWAPKTWCFWTVVLEKNLWSPLDCKKIQPVHPEGNQFWIFVGRTDAKAETPVLWPPDVKNWLIWEDSDAGQDWRWEETGLAEDEMVGWYHRLNGHEFEWTLGVGDGQGGLACYSLWAYKASNTSERLNWTKLNCSIPFFVMDITIWFVCFLAILHSISLHALCMPSIYSVNVYWRTAVYQILGQSFRAGQTHFLPSWITFSGGEGRHRNVKTPEFFKYRGLDEANTGWCNSSGTAWNAFWRT